MPTLREMVTGPKYKSRAELNDDFMKNVGKEGIRSQQKEMRETADDEKAIYAYRKTPVREPPHYYDAKSAAATRKRMRRKK